MFSYMVRPPHSPVGARMVLVHLGGILFTKGVWLVFFSKKRVVRQVSMEPEI